MNRIEVKKLVVSIRKAIETVKTGMTDELYNELVTGLSSVEQSMTLSYRVNALNNILVFDNDIYIGHINDNGIGTITAYVKPGFEHYLEEINNYIETELKK